MCTYTPFRSNEFAKKYGVQRPIVWLHGTLEADGHFRVPVIPGRGVVCLECNGNDYRFDLGKSEIKELANAPKTRIGADSPTLMPLEDLRYRRCARFPSLRICEKSIWTCWSNAAQTSFSSSRTRPASRSQESTLTVCTAGSRRGYSSTETDTARLRATYPGETRPIWLRHRASGLTKLFDFVAKAGETERPIILERPAVVTGQLVTDDGGTLSRVRIECLVPVRFPSASTDAAARFRYELPGGGRLN